MALKLKDKKEIVSDLAKVLHESSALVAAEYRGLTAEEMTSFRSKARSMGVGVRIARNTLVTRAIQDTSFTSLESILKGPLLLAFSFEDLSAAPKLVRSFAKEHEKLIPKGIVYDNQLLFADSLNKLAELPSKEEAISILLGTMTAALSQLVRVLTEPYAQFVRVVSAISTQKQDT